MMKRVDSTGWYGMPPAGWCWLGLLLLSLPGCERPVQSFFPLAVGWQWHYRLEVETADGRRQLRQVVTTGTPERVDGFPAHSRRWLNDWRFYYRRGPRGIYRIGSRSPEGDYRPEPAARYVLRYPLQVGTRWQQPETTRLLQRTSPPQETLFRIQVALPVIYVIDLVDGSVAVPAGRFDGCLRVSGHGETSADAGNYVGWTHLTLESRDWYCRGVGLVRSERTETTSNTLLPRGRMSMELEALLRP